MMKNKQKYLFTLNEIHCLLDLHCNRQRAYSDTDKELTTNKAGFGVPKVTELISIFRGYLRGKNNVFISPLAATKHEKGVDSLELEALSRKR